jgi:hypothetical protein
MSKYDAELRRRLLSGDDLPSVRTWFIGRVAESKLCEGDFTDFESLFWADIVKNYRAWKANRKLN